MTVQVKPNPVKAPTQPKKNKLSKLSKKVLISVLGLLIFTAIDISYLEIRHATGNKIGANQFISPWEHSYAPPQGLNKKLVKVHGAPRVYINESDGTKPRLRYIETAHSAKPKMTLKPKPVQGSRRARQTTAFAFAQQSYNRRVSN